MTQKQIPKINTSPRTPPPSFVKLAMKNMVRKGNQSILHFGITAVGFLTLVIFIAVIGRPTLPG